MSDEDVIGQVWEDTCTNSIWLVVGRDKSHYNERRVVCLYDSGYDEPGMFSFASDNWFASGHSLRLA